MEQPNILILPFPAQGHVKPMLYLAELLCDAGLHVTFLNTHHIHRRLDNLQGLSVRFPTLHFESMSDGLPEEHPRNVAVSWDLIDSVKNEMKPLFRDLLLSLSSSTSTVRPPVSCIIADGIMPFAIDVAEELQVKVISFRTFSACSLWTYFNLQKLIEIGEIPLGGSEMDEKVESIPGIEGVLRRRDLPSLGRYKFDQNGPAPIVQFFVDASKSMTRATALILNTFDSLEAPALTQLASLFPKIYTVGPLHSLLKLRIQAPSSNGCLRKADRCCIAWLDSQPPRSVIYVSFGSLVTLQHYQLMEFWHGLVDSGKRFLWVIRSDLLSSANDAGGEAHEMVKELDVGTKERGCIVGWAPQEEVLAHPAVGGFLTHSGWNSTMEAIVAGIPLICWPQLADQTVNSRWVGEVWKIGLDMKDTCDRSTVEKMVRALMEGQREEIMRSVDQIARMARDSVGEGGSSSSNLQMLIEDLKFKDRVSSE